MLTIDNYLWQIQEEKKLTSLAIVKLEERDRSLIVKRNLFIQRSCRLRMRFIFLDPEKAISHLDGILEEGISFVSSEKPGWFDRRRLRGLSRISPKLTRGSRTLTLDSRTTVKYCLNGQKPSFFRGLGALVAQRNSYYVDAEDSYMEEELIELTLTKPLLLECGGDISDLPFYVSPIRIGVSAAAFGSEPYRVTVNFKERSSSDWQDISGSHIVASLGGEIVQDTRYSAQNIFPINCFLKDAGSLKEREIRLVA